MANQTYRVLEIIKRFNQGQKVCISQLQNEAMWENKSEKTIRRDLDIIKAIFPNSFHLISGEIGCYKAITNTLFENIINDKNLSLLTQTLYIAQQSTLFDDLNIDNSDKKILHKKIKESRNIYLYKSKPFENRLESMEIFKGLERAIYYKREITIEYETPNSNLESITIKPYKIVFISENFYLASEVENMEYKFSLFRILKIKSLEYKKRIFKHNLEIVEFINDIQTPLAKYRVNYKEHLIEVIIEVKSQKAHYFKNKKFLDSQKIIEIKDNRDIIVSFMITDIIEIESFIMTWIPYVKVLSPLLLRDEIEKGLINYLKIF